jgi:hypothetical protein
MDARDDRDAELARLITDTEGILRMHVKAVRDFSCVLRGKSAEDISSRGDDGELLLYLDSVNRTNALPLPAFPEMNGKQFDLWVLRAAVERRLIKSWTLGSAAEFKLAAGTLPTIWPTHPAAPYCDIINYIGQPKHSATAFSGLLVQCPDKALVQRLCQAGAVLFPERGRSIMHLLPTADLDLRQIIDDMLKDPTMDLRDIVSQVLASPNVDLQLKVLVECIRRGKIDQAERLIKDTNIKMGKGKERMVEVFDKVAGASSAKVILLHGDFNYLAFHVVQPDGTAPRAAIDIQLDNLPVGATDILRRGTLVQVKAAGSGKVELAVTIRGKSIFLGEVNR